jgi:hypothetical protein
MARFLYSFFVLAVSFSSTPLLIKYARSKNLRTSSIKLYNTLVYIHSKFVREKRATYMMGALIYMTAFHSLMSRGMTLNKPCKNGMYSSAKCSAMLSVIAATSIGFAQSGRVSSDSDELSAFMALSISMTTKMLKLTVLADLAASLLKISQPISGKEREHWWKWLSW